MENVVIPAQLAAALHARLLADLRETQALVLALGQCQPIAPQPAKDGNNGDQ